MNKEINYKDWSVPNFSNDDKKHLLNSLQEQPHRKGTLSRLTPVLIAALLFVAAGVSLILYRSYSLNYQIKVVNKLLEKEIERHRQYIYFTDNVYYDWPDKEVFNERQTMY